MKRWISYLCLSVIVCGFMAVEDAKPQAARDAARPNIIYIMADDLGWTDLGCYGSGYYQTPNIDRLRKEGLKFTDAYTCGPNCQPTRAALMSGQYGPRTGTYTVGGIDRFDWQSRPLRPVDNVAKLPLEITILPQPLKQAGYATGMFGKWHLGDDGAHHPGRRGFDEAIVSAGRHFNFNTTPKQDVPEGTYLADWLTDRAVDFMERHKSGPFFLYLPHFGVHSPFEAKEELIAHFKGRPPAGKHRDPVYAAMIASVDQSVGRILDKLAELNLDEKTIVIFTSDNGGVGGYRDAGVITNKEATHQHPLRGGKGMLYEGGVRVPFIARWPGTIEANTTSAQPIITVDVYPTLLKLTGASAPADQPLDGVCIADLLDSGAERALFWHFPGYLGGAENTWRTTPTGVIRRGDWKLHEFFEDGRLELYNLAADIGERNNLAEAHPEKVRELHQEMLAWRKSVGAKMPTRNTGGGEDKAPAKKSGKKKNKNKKN